MDHDRCWTRPPNHWLLKKLDHFPKEGFVERNVEIRTSTARRFHCRSWEPNSVLFLRSSKFLIVLPRVIWYGSEENFKSKSDSFDIDGPGLQSSTSSSSSLFSSSGSNKNKSGALKTCCLHWGTEWVFDRMFGYCTVHSAFFYSGNFMKKHCLLPWYDGFLQIIGTTKGINLLLVPAQLLA